MADIKFNINGYCRIKLTEAGRMAHERYYRELEMTPPLIKVDAEGYCREQLWVVMMLYGKHHYNGVRYSPFETEIILEVP